MTETTNIALPAMRVSYEQGSLSESELAATWHEQLQLWLDQVRPLPWSTLTEDIPNLDHSTIGRVLKKRNCVLI